MPDMKNIKLSINPDQLSSSALEVWNSLSDGQQRTIQKEHPFRAARNVEIIALKRKGVKGPIIVEITGLSKSTVSRISKYFTAKYVTRNPEIIHESDVIKSLNEIVTLIDGMNKELSEIKTAILYKNKEK